MVTEKFIRNNSGRIYEDPAKEWDNSKALHRMIFAEFGYGCDVTEITPTSITTVTSIMGTVDTTVVSGSEEDMKLFVRAAELYVAFRQYRLTEGRDQFCETIVKATGGNPRLINLGMGIFLGGGLAKATCIGLLDPESIAQIEAVVKIDYRDLLVMVEFVLFNKMPLDEAIQLAA